MLAGHREDQVPVRQFAHADLARTMVGDLVAVFAQDPGSTTVDRVAFFFVGNSCGIHDDIDAGVARGFKQNLVGHRRPADVAGADHQNSFHWDPSN